MKFFGPKSLSQYLFYAFRILAIGLGLFTIYITFSFILGNYSVVDGRYKMDIPLTGTYIHGIDQTNIFVTISITLVFIVVFLHMFSNIFHSLKMETVFTKLAIKRLYHFAILNLVIGPILYFLIHFPIMQKTNFRDIHNLILQLLLGIFALFIIAVFKRGFAVQSENDLTI